MQPFRLRAEFNCVAQGFPGGELRRAPESSGEVWKSAGELQRAPNNTGEPLESGERRRASGELQRAPRASETP
eukprot:1655580-Alexandrium_andersonii.AAC.1